MKRFILILLCIPFLAFANDRTFNQVVFFGDSLSDTGNLYRALGHLIPKSPPYFEGHFSDGKMWVEKFYSHYFPSRDDVADYNYAVGGASAFYSPEAPLPYTLDSEVSDYLYFYAPSDISKVLYVVWIGGNNYIKVPHDGERTSDKAIEAIVYSIERLISHGANKFLIPNLPNLGRMPEATEGNNSDKLSKMTTLHNDKLEIAIDQLKMDYPDVTFVPYDAESTFEDVFNDPDKFDMHHVVEACFTGGYTFTPTHDAMEKYLIKNYQYASAGLTTKQLLQLLDESAIAETIKVAMYQETHNLDHLDCHDYLFWDHVHPTTIAHGYIAKYMINAVEDSGLKAED